MADLNTPVALNTPYSFQLSLTNGVLTVAINSYKGIEPLLCHLAYGNFTV